MPDPAAQGDDPGQPPWPPEDVRRIVDTLADSIIVIGGGSATILYLNPAASSLLDRPSNELIGQSVGEILPVDQLHWVDLLESAVAGTSTEIVGTRHDLVLRDGKGHRVPVEIVASVGMTRMGWPVAIAVVRVVESTQVQRLTHFTEELLELLVASSSSSPAEQVLSSLCRRLGWDVGALWGLQPDGSLICRDVWTDPFAPARAYVEEKRRNPAHDVGGLAKLVIERGSPVWFTDLASEPRFRSDGVLEDGLISACALPVRYGGQSLGAIKLMSRVRRPPDPELIDLVSAVSGPLGAILHALEQSAVRDELLRELEATRLRLELLLRANKAVSEASSFTQALDRLAEVAVSALADLCLIDVVMEDGSIRRLAARHRDPAKATLTSELLDRYPPDPEGSHPSADVMASGRSSWSPEMSEEFLRSTSRDDRHLEIIESLGFTSYMTVPLLVGEDVKGTVTLVSAGSSRKFTEADLFGAEELAAQVAGVVERARQFDWEREVSHTLQQSLLPERLPSVPGLVLSATYLPAAADAEVGGDWYDAVLLGEHRVALIVGDVQGHDMVAASIMGQLRHGLALLLSEGTPPGQALQRLNAFVVASAISHIATVLVADLDAGSGEVRMASAGHPPPIVVGRDAARALTVKPGPPLGIVGSVYEETSHLLGNEALLLFTDGLVERREQDLDMGIQRLMTAATSADSIDPQAVIASVIKGLLGDHRRADDVAIIAATRR